MSADPAEEEKLAELKAIVQGLKDRVRAQHEATSVSVQTASSTPIRIALPDVTPVLHARDAAQAKMAAIGSVNPRRGGPLNALVQTSKRAISRGLGWFVRDQITFNRDTMACVEAIMETLNETNRALASLAGQLGQQFDEHRLALDRAKELIAESERTHSNVLPQWTSFQQDWHRRLAILGTENQKLLESVRRSYEERLVSVEESGKARGEAQHANFTMALERTAAEIQRKFWSDMERARVDYERLIHAELRVVRQRAGDAPPPVAPALAAPSPSDVPFDYQAFANRFRGSEEYVRESQRFYLPYFAGRQRVLDIGCGRGEFLEVMREAGVTATGIELSEECVSYCRRKGLTADKADLFVYLSRLAGSSLDGIFSSQVIEHLTAAQIPEMIRLSAEKLERGGVLVLETPNPECLAIFATHFYLDPTHVRPVPSGLVRFYMEECGLGGIEVKTRFPAEDSWPELRELPGPVRDRFFGGLDYAIIGRKL